MSATPESPETILPSTEREAGIATAFAHKFGTAYYAPNETIHQLPLGECTRSITEALSSDYLSLGYRDIFDAVVDSLMEAPESDVAANYAPLKQAGLDVMAMAMQLKMAVYIWTVGDNGEYHDLTRGIHDPAYNYQKVKIERSGMRDRLTEMVGNDCLVDFTINTSAFSKESALRDILAGARKNGVRSVFIADDLFNNELIVQKLAAEYPELTIDFWLIAKDDDLKGNSAAHRDHVLPKLVQNAEDGTETVVIFDLDDTLFDTQGSLRRAAELTRAKLNDLVSAASL